MTRALAAIAWLVIALGSGHAQAQAKEASHLWNLSNSRSYEESYPGLGTSQHFSSPYGWIDVFSYGLRRNDWLEGTSDPQFEREFSEALSNVRQASAQGITSNLVVAATRDAIIGGQSFRVAEFSFVLRGQPSDSALYLTAKGGLLLKYRITVKANPEPPIRKLAEEFILEDLPSRSRPR
jgi:hypothetical protein